MQESLVLTLIGADRPGLVEALARKVSRVGGNWLASRMVRLAGRFAGVLEVSVPAARVAELRADLGDLAAEGLHVVVEGHAAVADVAASRLYVLDLVGADRPGIVREISQALAARGVNVEELVTDCGPAPMSGEMLFHAHARVRAPASVEHEALRGALEQLGNELVVDLSLEPLPASAGG